MNITMKQIKAKMEELYKAWLDHNDESYFEFWDSLRTLRNLYLLDDDKWNKIYDYDRELATKYN